MKWTVARLPNGEYYIYVPSPRNKEVARGMDRDLAEKIAAAHNAVIDMAFDSPGNVS